MAQRARKSSSILGLSSFPTDNATVEAAWREALTIREFGGAARVKSRRRLAQAQVARMQAENEAITATKNYCVLVRAQADQRLEHAERTLAKAERIEANATARAATMEDEIQFRLDDASRKRKNARSYAEKLANTARAAADALLSQTREGAKELASRMRNDASDEIRKILVDIEIARATAEDELAAQRLLTETAQIKVVTLGLDSGIGQVEPLAFVATPQKKSKTKAKKPLRQTMSAKKRSTKTRVSNTAGARPVRKVA